MPVRRHLDQQLRLAWLRAVDAIDAHGSLLKAAVSLGISQPALTKILQDFEEMLQLRLFDRHARGVRPTETGLAVVRSARRVLAELRRLDEELDQVFLPPGSGVVALGALPVTATGLLPGVLSRLRSSHPKIMVRLQQGRTEDLLPLLAAGELDLIVGRLYEPALPDSFLREPLWVEPISILARADHPIFAAPQVTAALLRNYDLVLPTVSQRVGQEIEHLLSLLGLEPATSIRSSSYGFIREMLHASDLMSMMPRLMMVGDLLRGTLRVVPLPVPAPPRPAGLILPQRTGLTPAGRAFIACLRAYVEEIGQRGLLPITGDYS